MRKAVVLATFLFSRFSRFRGFRRSRDFHVFAGFCCCSTCLLACLLRITYPPPTTTPTAMPSLYTIRFCYACHTQPQDPNLVAITCYTLATDCLSTTKACKPPTYNQILHTLFCLPLEMIYLAGPTYYLVLFSKGWFRLAWGWCKVSLGLIYDLSGVKQSTGTENVFT